MKTLLQKRIFPVLMLILIVLLFASCSNKESVDACLDGYTFGFLGGLWHGIIAPIDMILMFFRDDITVYAQNNSGEWYALGFVIGSGGWGFLGSRGSRMRRRKN